MKSTRKPNLLAAALLCAGLTLPARATGQEPPQSDVGTLDRETAGKVFKKPGYSPYAGRNYPTRVFWGDTHLHTALSLDAAAGGCNVGPDGAFRFARRGSHFLHGPAGETVAPARFPRGE